MLLLIFYSTSAFLCVPPLVFTMFCKHTKPFNTNSRLVLTVSVGLLLLLLTFIDFSSFGFKQILIAELWFILELAFDSKAMPATKSKLYWYENRPEATVIWGKEKTSQQNYLNTKTPNTTLKSELLRFNDVRQIVFHYFSALLKLPVTCILYCIYST